MSHAQPHDAHDPRDPRAPATANAASATIAGAPRGATYSPDITAPPSAPDAGNSAPAWSIASLVGVRFLVAYVFLYTVPFPLDQLPFVGKVGGWVNAFWRALVPWTAAHLLRLSHPVSLQPSGSGDKLFDWIQIVCMLGIAAITAIVWSALDRRRRSYSRLLAGLRVYLRLYLAVVLYGYAFDKIFPNQFSHLDSLKLTRYIGESSPDGYAWLFLGLSIPYEIFAGCCEATAATLLLFRRTTTLGALVGAGVMTNVFMLNMSFDIPVKQFSFHLLLFLVVVAAYDAKRVANLLLFDRATERVGARPLFESTKRQRWDTALAALLIAWVVFSDVRGEWRGYHQFGIGRPLPSLAGIYEVDEVAKNGVVSPGLITDSTRWRRLAYNGFGASVRLATDQLLSYGLRVDSVGHKMTFRQAPPDSLLGTAAAEKWSATPIQFTYDAPDHDHLILHGRIAGDSVDMRLHRRAEQSYLLVSHGMFHWVNEVPFFR